MVNKKEKKKFSTTIKEKYWKEKLRDLELYGFFFEYKNTIPFWNKRIKNIIQCGLPTKGVFLVGNKSEWVEIIEIFMINREDVPHKYKEAINTDRCWRIMCLK